MRVIPEIPMGARERRAEGVLLSGFFSVNWGNAEVSGNSRGCASITDMEGREDIRV